MSEKGRNFLRCLFCGFAVYSNSYERNCAKCEKPMKFICKESEEKKDKKSKGGKN